MPLIGGSDEPGKLPTPVTYTLWMPDGAETVRIERGKTAMIGPDLAVVN